MHIAIVTATSGAITNYNDDGDGDGDDSNKMKGSTTTTQVYFIRTLVWTKQTGSLTSIGGILKRNNRVPTVPLSDKEVDPITMKEHVPILGRSTNNSNSSRSSIQSEVNKMSKNIFVKGFAVMNRRHCRNRNKKERQAQQQAVETDRVDQCTRRFDSSVRSKRSINGPRTVRTRQHKQWIQYQ